MPTLGKLNRSAHLFYIDTTFGGATPEWYLVGKDVEDMSVELNPTVETTKNILDETSASDKGYEPSISVDTYYANPSDGAIYTKLKDIMMNRLTGDDVARRFWKCLSMFPMMNKFRFHTVRGWRMQSSSRKATADRRAVFQFRLPFILMEAGYRVMRL